MTASDEYMLRSSAPAVASRAPNLRRLYQDLPLLADLVMLVVLTLATRVMVGRVDFSTGLYVLFLALGLARVGGTTDRLHVAALDDSGRLFRLAVFAYAAVSLVTTAFPELGDVRGSSNLWVVGASVPALLLGRTVQYRLRRVAARRGIMTPTLVVGAGEVGQELISVLKNDSSYGMEIVGAVDDSARFQEETLGTRVIGRLADLGNLIRNNNCENVIVAFGSTNDAGSLRTIRDALLLNVDIWVVPRFFEMGGDFSGFDHIGSVPVVKVNARAEERSGWRVKRVLDILVSASLIAFTWPLMGVIAAAIKLDTPGPVLFRQERFGKNKRRFWMLKFRTMAVVPPEEEDKEWETDEDRITRVGRFLRRTSLDEFPQVFNVLRGDLSLVGPRPERPRYVDTFEAVYPGYADRHRVPAGITGWAQVNGLRGETSMKTRTRFDNYYIENWSFASDLKILLRTARTMMPRPQDLGGYVIDLDVETDPAGGKQSRQGSD
jgi:exopolysaccharide biosynthesis polyprenyl glycosylphosphotransferase